MADLDALRAPLEDFHTELRQAWRVREAMTPIRWNPYVGSGVGKVFEDSQLEGVLDDVGVDRWVSDFANAGVEGVLESFGELLDETPEDSRERLVEEHVRDLTDKRDALAQALGHFRRGLDELKRNADRALSLYPD